MQNCSLLHPKTAILNLITEKIVGISASVTRASVWTDTGKVIKNFLICIVLSE